MGCFDLCVWSLAQFCRYDLSLAVHLRAQPASIFHMLIKPPFADEHVMSCWHVSVIFAC